MKFYHFDPNNEEYLGESDAQLDPGEAALGREVYLIPAHALLGEDTGFLPAPGENEVIIRNGLSVELVPDYRGTEHYDPNTGEKLIIENINETPVVIEAPSSDFREPSWNGSEWIDNYPWTVDERREAEYNKRGLTIQALTVALFEKQVENRPESADAIQIQRLEVKAMYPKE